MIRVSGSNPSHHLIDQVVVRAVSPCLKVVPAFPHDIRRVLVAAPEECSVIAGLHRTVVSESGQPAARLNWVKEHDKTIGRRSANQSVQALEVGCIRSGQVIIRSGRSDGEWSNAI